MTEVADQKSFVMTGPEPSDRDWPSYLYVSLALLNTLLIIWSNNLWLLMPLIVIQTGIFIGMLELLNQTAERNFSKNPMINDFFGTCVGAFLWVNHEAYRQAFRKGVDNKSQYLKYMSSPKSKDLWRGVLLSSFRHFYRACRMNGCFLRADTVDSHNRRQRCRDTMIVIDCCMALFAFIDFYRFSLIYLLPFVFALAFDELMIFVAVRKSAKHHQPGLMMNVDLPRFMSVWLLGRNRLRSTQEYPALRWFQVALMAA